MTSGVCIKKGRILHTDWFFYKVKTNHQMYKPVSAAIPFLGMPSMVTLTLVENAICTVFHCGTTHNDTGNNPSWGRQGGNASWLKNLLHFHVLE